MGVDIGIDLGTANIVIYSSDGGIVLNEPSIVAIDSEKKVLAIGEEAKKMIGKTPFAITIVRPLRNGVISTFTVTELMLRYFLGRAIEKKLVNQKPRMVLCVPIDITSVERYAIESIAKQVGAREVTILDEPIVAALGAGLDINKPQGEMVLDIGGGTADVAVISCGEVVTGKSLKVAGDKLTKSIVFNMKKERNLIIGTRTGELIKIKIGNAYKGSPIKYLEIRGQSRMSGLPEKIIIDSDEVRKYLEKDIIEIFKVCRDVLEVTPPELVADIYDNGMLLTGGGGLLDGLDIYLSDLLGIKVNRADEALFCVAKGIGVYMDTINK